MEFSKGLPTPLMEVFYEFIEKCRQLMSPFHTFSVERRRAHQAQTFIGVRGFHARD